LEKYTMTEQTLNPEETLALYAGGPDQLEAVLEPLSEADLDLSLAPDAWTIRQIVHHIADGDDLWKTCIKAALGNPEGLFHLQWYWEKPQTEWAGNWHYANRPIEPSLALFRLNRQHIIELVRLTPNAWEQSICLKTPRDEEVRITVGDVLESQAQHVVGHIQDIQAILCAHRS
jgi:hypothetical protein